MFAYIYYSKSFKKSDYPRIIANFCSFGLIVIYECVEEQYVQINKNKPHHC